MKYCKGWRATGARLAVVSRQAVVNYSAFQLPIDCTVLVEFAAAQGNQEEPGDLFAYEPCKRTKKVSYTRQLWGKSKH